MSMSTTHRRESPAIATAVAPAVRDPLRLALLDSRQRLRALVSLAADFALETDAAGRFTFVTPDPALGWTAAGLLGRPASDLLLDAPTSGFDPFRPTIALRGRRVWVRRADGTSACLSFSLAPLADGGGGGPVVVRGDVLADAAGAAVGPRRPTER